MNVLVTDGDDRAALAVTRSLGRRYRVDVVAPGPRSLTGRSRFAAAHHRAPAPVRDPAGFVSCLAELVRARDIALVLPISDAACCALLDRPGALVPATLAVPAARAYAQLSDKGRCAELARAHGLELPGGEEVVHIDPALSLAGRLGWPVIFKPSTSIQERSDGTLGRPAVELVAGPDALRRAWLGSGVDRALIQEWVPGWGEGIFLLRWAGRTRAVFAHRRLREKPPSGGVSVLRESCAVDPARLASIEAMLDAIGYQGVAMAEFRTDGRRAWLMEFNARFWGSLQLAIDAGVDFPCLLLDAIRGIDTGPPPVYRLGIRSRWLLGDLDHAIALARGSADPQGRKGLGAALRVLLTPAGPLCRWEVLRVEDPLPFAHELCQWVRAL